MQAKSGYPPSFMYHLWLFPMFAYTVCNVTIFLKLGIMLVSDSAAETVPHEHFVLDPLRRLHYFSRVKTKKRTFWDNAHLFKYSRYHSICLFYSVEKNVIQIYLQRHKQNPKAASLRVSSTHLIRHWSDCSDSSSSVWGISLGPRSSGWKL